MATGTKTPEPSQTTSKQQNQMSIHYYHAEAHVLSGQLDHPIKQPIPRHAEVVLKNNRRDHVTESVAETSLEGLISFKSGQSRVSGVKIDKRKNWDTDHSGWVTLSTSVIEGLNVFEVITADRIVSQVSTEHPFENGHVPRVTFLGSQFKNLQVSGFPVPVTLDPSFCGEKPDGDLPYLKKLAFLEKVRAQTEEVLEGMAKEKEIELPKDLKSEYAGRLADVETLIAECNTPEKVSVGRKVKCSLVKNIGKIPIPGVKAYGNVLMIPNFGWVALAEVEVGIELAENPPYAKSGNGKSSSRKDSNYFDLKMLDMHLGCVGGGKVVAGNTKTNGTTYP